MQAYANQTRGGPTPYRHMAQPLLLSRFAWPARKDARSSIDPPHTCTKTGQPMICSTVEFAHTGGVDPMRALPPL